MAKATGVAGLLELDGGLICFGGCARAAPPGPRFFGDGVVLVEAAVPKRTLLDSGAPMRAAWFGEAAGAAGVRELDGGLICFGSCAPGTPLLGDGVVLVETAVP